DDHRADGADFGRTLQRMTGHGLRRAGSADGLVEHRAGDGDEYRQRVGAPAVGGHEASQPALLTPAAAVAIRPDPPGSTPPRQRITLGAQRLAPVVAKNRRPVAPAPLGVEGHFPRMAQHLLAGTLGAPTAVCNTLSGRHTGLGSQLNSPASSSVVPINRALAARAR